MVHFRLLAVACVAAMAVRPELNLVARSHSCLSLALCIVALHALSMFVLALLPMCFVALSRCQYCALGRRRAGSCMRVMSGACDRTRGA